MRRGFDELNNPAGYTFVVALGLLLLAAIAVGAVFARAAERERRARREALRNQAPPADSPSEK